MNLKLKLQLLKDCELKIKKKGFSVTTQAHLQGHIKMPSFCALRRLERFTRSKEAQRSIELSFKCLVECCLLLHI